MIKYPVKVKADALAVEIGDDEWGSGFFVLDASDKKLGELELEEDANTIANALNAMNEYPEGSPFNGNKAWVQLNNWKKKYKQN